MNADTSEATVLLDVGHGNCAVIRSGGMVAIVDSGSSNALEQHLLNEEISFVDFFFLSHADQDHIQGAMGVMASDRFSVGAVYVNADAGKTSQLWDDLLWELDNAATEDRTNVHIGLTPADGPFSVGNVKLRVLGPGPYLCGHGVGGRYLGGKRISSNSISAVIAVEHDNACRVLLTGDVDKIGIDDLQRRAEPLTTDVLVFPHHGGQAKGASPRLFASTLSELTQAGTTVFSTGRAATWANPDPEIVRGVLDILGTQRILCTQLSRHCSKSKGESSGHLLPVVSRGRERNECCAGSIIVPHRGSVKPHRRIHKSFIRRAAATPLCGK